MKKKLFIIGLDGVPPEIAFDDKKINLKNLRKLFREGFYSSLRSIVPPITIPAWLCMSTGRDPGELGIYGFRNRKEYTYDFELAISPIKKYSTFWDVAGEKGKKVILVGIPPSYPPREVNGIMLSCFLTPSTTSQFTYPPDVKDELLNKLHEVVFDVSNFRRDDKIGLLRDILHLTERRFELYKYLMNKEWDIFFFVEMGPDRMHHGFWKYFDETHRKYERHHQLNLAMKNYYEMLDEKIGELLSMLDDNTIVVVVSDHGAKKMDGGICINEWLINQGYLKLNEVPVGMKNIRETDVRWEETLAWGEGGYYSRVFLNIKGREPRGKIERKDYKKVRDEIKEGIEGIKTDAGDEMNTLVFYPEEIYRDVQGYPPDLIVIFDDLNWRGVGTVGWNSLWTFENDTGPDDANHSWDGIISITSPFHKIRNQNEVDILSFARTMLDLIEIEADRNIIGGTSLLEK